MSRSFVQRVQNKRATRGEKIKNENYIVNKCRPNSAADFIESTMRVSRPNSRVSFSDVQNMIVPCGTSAQSGGVSM